MLFNNPTSLSAALFRKRDKNLVPFAVCVAKRSYRFDFSTKNNVQFADTESELVVTDQYSEQHEGLLVRANDLCPVKPFADIYFINPVAYSKNQTNLESWDVEVTVGRLNTSLCVAGKRVAQKSILGWNFSAIEPTNSVRVGYDLAYGGRLSETDEYEMNPVGKGFGLKGKTRVGAEFSLPQLAVDQAAITRPLSNQSGIGLGPIPCNWLERRRFAGTFDDDWEENRSPALPADFNNRFHNVAPSELQYPGYLSGNESVELRGLHPRGDVRFDLPVDYSIGLLLRNEMKVDFLSMLTLDTLVFDLNQQRVDMTWRTCFPRLDHDWEGALAIFPWEDQENAAA